MKKILYLIFILVIANGQFSITNAQAPNAIPFQGVARNSAGNILASQPIKLRILIHDVVPTGTVVYSETHTVTTTTLGLFNLNIGQGAIISGTLAGVNWGTGSKFMQVKLDPAPPSTYIDMGTTQLNSVPYALYAETFRPGNSAGEMLFWNGSSWVAIPSGTNGQILTLVNGLPVWQTPVGFINSTINLRTTAASNIQAQTATCGGDISGSATPVTERGVCWSASPDPTTANSKTIDGTGIGIFSSNLTGLTYNTTYYVRAYATNGAGTAYGNEISFTTPTLPTVTTTSVVNIHPTGSEGGGNISNGGGVPVTARGVCWSTSPNPTTTNSKTIDGSGIGTFISNLTGLTDSTNYYVRAYATNSVGTAYGNEVSFVFTPSVSLSDIGQPWLGGILAYILQPGDPGYDANVKHGLIAAPTDQSTGTEWGCYGPMIGISGADGMALGTGNQNTIDIMAACSTSGIAARICGDLVLNGYSDWFLPSQDELHKLYLNQVAIGGFTATFYWTSTEYNPFGAYHEYFFNSSQGASNKADPTRYVRAVRYF